MKFIFFGLLMTSSINAFAMFLTSEQEVTGVRAAVSPILAKGGFGLVEGSVNLEAYHSVDALRFFWNQTAGLIAGVDETFRFYRVSFLIQSQDGRTSPARTYAVVSDWKRDGQRDCAHDPRSCVEIVKGLLRVKDRVAPTLSDILRSEG